MVGQKAGVLVACLAEQRVARWAVLRVANLVDVSADLMAASTAVSWAAATAGRKAGSKAVWLVVSSVD